MSGNCFRVALRRTGSILRRDWISILFFIALLNVAAAIVDITAPGPKNQPAKSESNHSDKNEEEEGEKRPLWVRIWDSSDKLSTLAIALFNGLLVYVTFRLVTSTDKLWIAGERQLYQSRRSSERQLRAYVSATPRRVYNFSSSVAIEISFEMINHGRTPAYDVTTLTKVDTLPYPLTDNFDPRVPDTPPKASRSVLFPNQTRYGRGLMKRVLDHKQIGEITKATDVRLYIIGVVKYKDTFDVPHTTRFCYSHIGGERLKEAMTSPVRGPILDEMVFEAADQHNDAD